MSVTVDFLNTAAHVFLFFLLMRWTQMKLAARDPDSGTVKALSYLFH